MISEREEKQKKLIELMEESKRLDSEITRQKEKLEKDDNVKGE